ncbi:hypothetical protein PHMEG_00011341 [Phytophthora megakarya]|uniref:HAT C-terminal dimerisation domain-containing protein n=1 Tax=Phytophthora megakarya TaxID=4795 RepID=A0A225WBZ3_9STRA|nr:hypothetical protein PHMEG_00011341 [Phytophthora megakarya]
MPVTTLSGAGALPAIAVYYYRRLYSTEDIGIIRDDMFDWMKGKFTKVRASEFACPWKYWAYIQTPKPDSLLPKLAIAVLSIAVNTATCERLFSALRLLHTTKRNRLGWSKALDIETIAKHVRQRALN